MITVYYANASGFIVQVDATMVTKFSVTLANEGTYPRKTEHRIYADTLEEAADFARKKLMETIIEANKTLEKASKALDELETKYGMH